MKPLRIKVEYPGHWLDGRILKARRSRLAGPHGHDLGACFTIETKYGKFAIPMTRARVLTTKDKAARARIAKDASMFAEVG